VRPRVLSILADIIVLAYPGLTLLGLAVILGIWLVVFGMMECVLAWRLRSVRWLRPPSSGRAGFPACGSPSW
jgi:hypothetical protein